MTLDSAMLACSVVMEGALLGILMRRGIGSRLPWFGVYIAWSLVSDVAGWLAMGRFPALYMRFYLYETAVDCALQFALLLELGWSVLRCIHAQLDKRNVWLDSLSSRYDAVAVGGHWVAAEYHCNGAASAPSATDLQPASHRLPG